MEVKIKKLHPHAVIPTYSTIGSAGMDITCIAVEYDPYTKIVTYKTGLAIQIPEGYLGLLFPRSSIYKQDLLLANSVGVIDSDYTGEILLKYRDIPVGVVNGDMDSSELSYGGKYYREGHRVAQLIIIPYPPIEFIETQDLEETERGIGGFGSTGK